MLGWLARLVSEGLAIPFDLALIAAFGAALVLNALEAELPQVDGLIDVEFEEPLRIFTAKGALMAEFGVQRRRAVAFDEIPPLLIHAFIAVEDSRFFQHDGIDAIGLARAAFSVARSGEATQGGSTISMQVARNFFLSRDKTVKRKLTEILLAWRLEARLSKEAILSLYLNKIFFGHRSYGVAAAAEFYYQKTLDELTLAEMAMLAGLPQAPSVNNPLTNPERAIARRNFILERMHVLGYIDETDLLLAITAPLTAQRYVPVIELRADYLAEMARQEIVQRYGEEDAYRLGLRVYTTVDENLQREADEALRRGLMAYNQRHGYHGPEAKVEDVAELSVEALDALLAERPQVPGLPVGIVINASGSMAEVYLGKGETRGLGLAQVKWARPFKTENWRGPAPRRVTDAVAVGDVIRLREDKPDDWVLAQVPKVGGALVALTPEDGAIRALSGGYAFEWSKFNRALDAKRQPGSTFKPFVYAAALGKGYTPASLVKDERFEMPSAQGMWRPKNADGKFMGPIRIRVALSKSRNLAIVNLINRMSVKYAREFIQNFGFTLESMPVDMSMALGSGSMTPLELARGFAVFANGGYRVLPYLIDRIEDARGQILYDAQPPRACMECWIENDEEAARVQAVGASEGPKAPLAIDPRIAYNMDSMLKDVILSGTATRAKQLNRDDIAGKTGTTNESRDSWFAGYQPRLVTVVWVGRDDNKPLGKGEWGGTAALGIWIDFMQDALADIPVATIKRPEGMVPVRISLSSGDKTRSKSNSRIEYIRDEYQLMTLGPDPVRYSAPVARKKAAPKRTAPRMMDELF
ncbi:MAG: PBP1A family penicillin-binding protein [Lamprobacter sp.]|uniref:penicillin-binding protein 1A n=1 Tax=Lamprobacter sp. TaxID=3100796 RepID=UPI002B262F9A|nr:PBP1A family penicillin-binding protein [Lamprobacter sp.]MEA3638697.1 PBP1A family penicillin-binding protein [Lamprobacter sp.]